MPRGKEVDKAVRDHIHRHGYGDKFIHGTGHSLGITNAHGNNGRLRRNSNSYLRQNVAYTIEPGIYLPGEFGVRSEIDFYVDENFKFAFTVSLQKDPIFL